jgi:hypothetical protein
MWRYVLQTAPFLTSISPSFNPWTSHSHGKSPLEIPVEAMPRNRGFGAICGKMVCSEVVRSEVELVREEGMLRRPNLTLFG